MPVFYILPVTDTKFYSGTMDLFYYPIKLDSCNLTYFSRSWFKTIFLFLFERILTIPLAGCSLVTAS